jgi:3'-5' exoribonuclease
MNDFLKFRLLSKCTSAFTYEDVSRFEICRDITTQMFEDERFMTWPGSVDKHHIYPGGLFSHTVEVVALTLSGMEMSATFNAPPLDTLVVYTAALLHDVGKIWAYVPSETHIGKWEKSPHYRKTLHVEKSDEYFREHFAHKFSPEIAVAISHCIRSHHGRIEYGALEEPKTPEAWAVHLADMYSAFCIERRKTLE